MKKFAALTIAAIVASSAAMAQNAPVVVPAPIVPPTVVVAGGIPTIALIAAPLLLVAVAGSANSSQNGN